MGCSASFRRVILALETLFLLSKMWEPCQRTAALPSSKSTHLYVYPCFSKLLLFQSTWLCPHTVPGTWQPEVTPALHLISSWEPRGGVSIPAGVSSLLQKQFVSLKVSTETYVIIVANTLLNSALEFPRERKVLPKSRRGWAGPGLDVS